MEASQIHSGLGHQRGESREEIQGRLEPLGQRLLPVRSLPQALGFGLVWGWPPCGLVYSPLLWSASSGSVGRGTLYIMAFGPGTLPAMRTTGLLTGWVTRLMRQPKARAVIGVSLIAFGVASVWFVPQHDHTQMDHAGHANSTVTDKLSD